MISQLETEKRNLESSLLFMQQEHSGTLKALHEEISKLQKKCKELTFELTMQDHIADETGNQGVQAKVDELQVLLKDGEDKHRQLTDDLEIKNKTISDLKGQLKKNEKAFIDELKRKDQQVLALKVELDNKGGTIAYLTTEMHRYKVLQHSATKELVEPPQSPTTSDQIGKRRSLRVSSASDIKSRPVTAKGTMPRPDAEVFLATATALEPQSEIVAVKPTPPVLPPITGGDEAHKKSFTRRQQLIRRRLELKSQPEYSKLAVDKLASNSNTWVHEPNTTTK